MSFRLVPSLDMRENWPLRRKHLCEGVEMLLLARARLPPSEDEMRRGQRRARLLLRDGEWGPLRAGEMGCFIFVPPEQAWGLVPGRSSSAAVEGIIDGTRFHVAKVNIR